MNLTEPGLTGPRNHTLHELAILTRTDKVCHTYFGRSYLQVDAIYLDEIRESARNVVEFGVLSGCSLRMWREYFHNADVYGVDVNPDLAKLETGTRTKIIIASQDDPTLVDRICPGEPIDLVVDDGSHLVDHIVTSFKLWWPRIKSGGYYIIEDMECSYWDLTKFREVHPGMVHNSPGTNFNNDRAKLEREVLHPLIKTIDMMGPNDPTNEHRVQFVHFWPNQCIIRKA